MRKLIAVVLIAASLWGGYWFIGSTAVEKGLRSWFATQQQRGWTAQYTDISTRGFPNRFDTTITDLDLQDPATGFGWRAPFFQILALSYKPTQIIAAFPNDQTVLTPAEAVTVTSTQMRASATFVPGTDLTLDHSAVVADGVALNGENGWSATMGQLRIATRPAVGVQHAHDFDLVALELSPDASLRAALDPDATLPDAFDTVKIDATLGFDAPWDRFALGDARPHLTVADLTEARATWGLMDLRAVGRVMVDDSGFPDGQLTIEATEWRRMVAIATQAGLIPQGMTGTVERLLEALSRSTGDVDTLELPLTFANGRMALGPVDLGPAPRLSE